MEIEDAGELTVFETQAQMGTLYLTAIRHRDGSWMGGPSGMDKAEVMRALNYWHGIDAARVYAVKVPLNPLPGA